MKLSEICLWFPPLQANKKWNNTLGILYRWRILSWPGRNRLGKYKCLALEKLSKIAWTFSGLGTYSSGWQNVSASLLHLRVISASDFKEKGKIFYRQSMQRCLKLVECWKFMLLTRWHQRAVKFTIREWQNRVVKKLQKWSVLLVMHPGQRWFLGN